MATDTEAVSPASGRVMSPWEASGTPGEPAMLVAESLPSLPFDPAPKHNVAPSAKTTHVWSIEAAICVTMASVFEKAMKPALLTGMQDAWPQLETDS